MENRIPALSLGFGSSWTCWTGWICFSLLDLFRSSPLLKPKEFKCPAGACAPLPCPAFYLLFFQAMRPLCRLASPGTLSLGFSNRLHWRKAHSVLRGLLGVLSQDEHHPECLSVTGPCRDTVTQTLQLLSAASSSLSPTCRLDANPQTTDGSHWDYLCITL